MDAADPSLSVSTRSTRAARHAGSSAKSASVTRRQQQRKADRVPVERDRVCARQDDGAGTDERREGKLRERDARDGRGDGQDRGLDQHLTDEAAAVGAERPAHGHLARAALAADEQQVGDVGAGDEQQASDGAEHQQQRGPHGGGRLIGRGDGERRELHRHRIQAFSASVLFVRSASCAFACSIVAPGARRATA